ncbi:hypothetical protein EUGRSUZ_C03826 [Eucalyptus grandis]|uniref:Uncharacterized protein n=4 Tax=Eucalyptus grandis TaxID=71139 RepID=A0ACC3LJF5_EUCGR|nr:hypothetical protein EUGRSUZ_C03826 [Eucalyptus grandis]
MSTPLPVSSPPAGTNTTVLPLAAATTTSAFPLRSASSGSSPRPLATFPLSRSTISTEAVVVGVGVGVAVVVGVGLLFIHCKKKGWRFCSASSSNDLGFSVHHFTFDELEKSTDGFSEANLLGEGGFGHVYRGVLSTGKDVAVKRLKVGSGQGEREFLTEVEIISRVHHKHVVSLVGYCTAGSERILVYELVPNKTLEFHLHGEGQPTLDWPTRLKIAFGAAEGLAYLHEGCDPNIIHRDIKATNILVDHEFKAKIADFGIAKVTSNANSHVSTNVKGSIGYLDPEYFSSRNPTEKSDVFSFGVVLWELITGRRPVGLVDWVRPQLTRYLEDGNFDSLVDPGLQNYDPDEMARMVQCAAACVHPSGERRPKMSKIVRDVEGDPPLSDLNGGMKRGPGNRQTRGWGLLRLWYPSRPQKVQKDARTRRQPGSSSAGPSRPIAQDLEMGKDVERQSRFRRRLLNLLVYTLHRGYFQVFTSRIWLFGLSLFWNIFVP